MLQDLFDVFQSLFQRLLQILPHSPFQNISVAISNADYLAYLNWFFPISECITVIEAWLIAIATLYLWSIVARWIKVIT